MMLGDGPLARPRRYLKAPRTWVNGEFVTAAMMNTIRDSFHEIKAGTMSYGRIASIRGISAPTPTGVLVPLFTLEPLPTLQVSLYLISAGLGFTGDPVAWASYAIAALEGNTARIDLNNGTHCILSLDGLTVMANQQSGTSYPIQWVALRIG